MPKRILKKRQAQHFSLTWNILEVQEMASKYEKNIGNPDKAPYCILRKMYEGDLLPAIHFQRIKNLQKYGVTFYAKLNTSEGECLVERGFCIDTPIKFHEFINGNADCYVNHGNGLKTKGWRGASAEWLAMMDNDFKGDLCIDAWAVANCLVRG